MGGNDNAGNWDRSWWNAGNGDGNDNQDDDEEEADDQSHPSWWQTPEHHQDMWWQQSISEQEQRGKKRGKEPEKEEKGKSSNYNFAKYKRGIKRATEREMKLQFGKEKEDIDQKHSKAMAKLKAENEARIKDLEEKYQNEQDEVMRLLQDLADAEAAVAKGQREMQLMAMAAASATTRTANLEEELGTATRANTSLVQKLEEERSAVRARNRAIVAWRARVMALQEELSELQVGSAAMSINLM